MKLRIRQATTKDVEQIKAIVSDVLWEFGLPTRIDSALADLSALEQEHFKGYFGVVVDLDGEIVGTVGLFPRTKQQVEIRKFYLLKEEREKAKGKELLHFLLQKAKELGFRSIHLDSSAAFLQAIGLLPIKEEKAVWKSVFESKLES